MSETLVISYVLYVSIAEIKEILRNVGIVTNTIFVAANRENRIGEVKEHLRRHASSLGDIGQTLHCDTTTI